MPEKFHSKEFECEDFSKQDYELLEKITKCEDKGKQDNDFKYDLRKAYSPYEIMQVYRDHKDNFKEFAKANLSNLKKTTESELETLFKKLDNNLEVEFFIDWIIRDGGEVRGPFEAKNSDGSIKKGYVEVLYS
ncbi:MAG: hypothetical protein ACP5OG_04285 [Candidatus Nanoarchaeia archaeon]